MGPIFRPRVVAKMADMTIPQTVMDPRVVELEAELAELRERCSQLERLALRDPLTDLPNRRALAEDMAREMARAEREHEPLCVGFIDIDKFKEWNDSKGHAQGDHLLALAARAWRRALRASDLLFRLAGDEFAVILPSCDRPEAAEVLERLARATPFEQTVSIGVARYTPGESPDDAWARADEAMYVHKNAKRAPR
jgi:diguanylate cyclase (GGDEF)-like protein